jgi:hypothetical protein
VSQYASPKSGTATAGNYISFTWTPADFSLTNIPNANYTCVLKPGMTLNWTERNYQEEIGS